jgi:hypothetical protein
MLQLFVQRYAAVSAAERPRMSGARGRERRESHARESDRASDVPRVRHHEAPVGVQAVESVDLVAL